MNQSLVERSDTQSPSLGRSASIEYCVSLLFYAFIASAFAYLRREQLNPDGATYIRFATYIAEGRPWMAVSGYWSPLFIICMAPLQALGMDGMIAARAVLAVWGAGIVAGCLLVSRTCLNVSRGVRICLASVVAVNVAYWSTIVISPDVLLSACLLAYAALTYDSRLFDKRYIAFLAGAIAGAAYLAKSYGLPFFLVHFTLVIALHLYFGRTSLIKAFRTWTIGMAAFALVAGPWIAVLSYKYGKPTFSTSAAINFAIIGPDYGPEKLHKKYRPHSDELRVPPAGRHFLSEDLDMQVYHYWSPFASKSNFIYFVKKLIHTAANIVDSVRFFDFLAVMLNANIFFPLILLAVGKCNKFQIAWIWIAVGPYMAGFLPVFYETRYLYGFIWVLFAASGTQMLCDLLKLLRPDPSPQFRRQWLFVAGLVIVASACYYPISRTLADGSFAPKPGYLRVLCAKLASEGHVGPVACGECYSQIAFGIAYYLNVPILGEPRTQTVQAIENEMAENHVSIFVISSKWKHFSDFVKNSKWVLNQSIQSPDDPEVQFNIYCAPGE